MEHMGHCYFASRAHMRKMLMQTNTNVKRDFLPQQYFPMELVGCFLIKTVQLPHGSYIKLPRESTKDGCPIPGGI